MKNYSDISFPSTRWSKVVAATDPAAQVEAQTALSELCQSYWFPLYGFLRRKGHSPPDAEDLTQAFFVKILSGDLLSRANPDLGRLRSFLLKILSRFVFDEADKGRALKRGGQQCVVSIDAILAEEQLALEPADHITPEALFDRRWALTIIENVMTVLRRDYEEAGKSELFKVLEDFLAAPPDRHEYALVAPKLGMKEGSVRVAVFRLRRRYGELLRAHITDTVSSPEEVPDELDYLMRALSL